MTPAATARSRVLSEVGGGFSLHTGEKNNRGLAPEANLPQTWIQNNERRWNAKRQKTQREEVSGRALVRRGRAGLSVAVCRDRRCFPCFVPRTACPQPRFAAASGRTAELSALEFETTNRAPPARSPTAIRTGAAGPAKVPDGSASRCRASVPSRSARPASRLPQPTQHGRTSRASW
jgi:hypothetical protein